MTRRMPPDIIDAPRQSTEDALKFLRITVLWMFIALGVGWGAWQAYTWLKSGAAISLWPSHFWSDQWRDIPWGIPWYLIPISIGTFVFALFLMKEKWKELAAIAVAICFLFYLFYLYGSHQLGATATWPFYVVLYVMAASVAAMLATTLPEGRRWTVTTAFSLAAFGTLGLSHDISPERLRSVSVSWSPSAVSTTAAATFSGRCDGGEYEIMLGSTPVDLRTNGQCPTDWRLKPGTCIYLRTIWDSRAYYGPFGTCPSSVGFHGPNDVTEAWSAGAPMKAFVRLLPRGSR